METSFIGPLLTAEGKEIAYKIFAKSNLNLGIVAYHPLHIGEILTCRLNREDLRFVVKKVIPDRVSRSYRFELQICREKYGEPSKELQWSSDLTAGSRLQEMRFQPLPPVTLKISPFGIERDWITSAINLSRSGILVEKPKSDTLTDQNLSQLLEIKIDEQPWFRSPVRGFGKTVRRFDQPKNTFESIAINLVRFTDESYDHWVQGLRLIEKNQPTFER